MAKDEGGLGNFQREVIKKVITKVSSLRDFPIMNRLQSVEFNTN